MWIKAEHDLPDKAEVVAISTRLGIDQDSVTGKLLRVWIWFDKNSADGVMQGVTPGVIDRMTYAPGFGEAMRHVGWIVFNQDGSARLSNFDRHNGETSKTRGLAAKRAQAFRSKSNAKSNGGSVTPGVTPRVTSESESESLNKSKVSSNKRSMGKRSLTLTAADILEISEEEIWQAATIASSLFKRCDYSGPDGALLWKAAVLTKRALIAEAWIHDAAKQAGSNSRKNPVGFFRTTLKETCGKNGVDLDFQIARLKLPSDHPCGPPQNGFSSELREMAAGIGKGVK